MQKHHTHMLAGLVIGAIVGYVAAGYFSKPKTSMPAATSTGTAGTSSFIGHGLHS